MTRKKQHEIRILTLASIGSVAIVLFIGLVLWINSLVRNLWPERGSAAAAEASKEVTVLKLASQPTPNPNELSPANTFRVKSVTVARCEEAAR